MSRGQARAKPALPRPAGDPLASISRRSLAWIIDVVLVTVLIFIGVSLLDAAFGPAVRFEPDAATLSDTVAADMGMVVLNALLGTGLSAAYFVLPWALMGGSPAQLALRMRVRSDTDCEALPVWRAIARWILLFPPFATVSALTAGMPVFGAVVWSAAVAWYLILLLTTARSATRQGLHDRVAATVVRRRAGSAYGAVDVR